MAQKKKKEDGKGDGRRKMKKAREENDVDWERASVDARAFWTLLQLREDVIRCELRKGKSLVRGPFTGAMLEEGKEEDEKVYPDRTVVDSDSVTRQLKLVGKS